MENAKDIFTSKPDDFKGVAGDEINEAANGTPSVEVKVTKLEEEEDRFMDFNGVEWTDRVG